MSLVFLDCCRDWPFAGSTRSVGGQRGLAPVDDSLLGSDGSIGSMVMFAAGKGEKANDRANHAQWRDHSPFTAGLLQNFTQPARRAATQPGGLCLSAPAAALFLLRGGGAAVRRRAHSRGPAARRRG